MNEKTKLYVFTKIEVILIFIFMLLIAPTFFLIGFRLGIGYSYKEAGLTQYEKSTLELRSQKEENVEQAASELKQEEMVEKLPDESMKKLQQKIENLDRVETPQEPVESKDKTQSILGKPQEEIEKKNGDDPFNKAKDTSALNSDKYSGKYTIQLASYRKLEDAEAFANGFKVRGYNPIISTAEISSGVWFRVSLETFDSINDAKNYIKQERELFMGSEYSIVKFE